MRIQHILGALSVAALVIAAVPGAAQAQDKMMHRPHHMMMHRDHMMMHHDRMAMHRHMMMHHRHRM